MALKRPAKQLAADLEKVHPDILEAGRWLIKQPRTQFKFHLGEPELRAAAFEIERAIIGMLRTVAAEFESQSIHNRRPTPRCVRDGDTLVFWYDYTRRGGGRTSTSKPRLFMVNR